MACPDCNCNLPNYCLRYAQIKRERRQRKWREIKASQIVELPKIAYMQNLLKILGVLFILGIVSGAMWKWIVAIVLQGYFNHASLLGCVMVFIVPVILVFIAYFVIRAIVTHKKQNK